MSDPRFEAWLGDCPATPSPHPGYTDPTEELGRRTLAILKKRHQLEELAHRLDGTVAQPWAVAVMIAFGEILENARSLGLIDLPVEVEDDGSAF